jgi:hypothetical protein
MRHPRTIIAGIGLATMAVGGITAIGAGGSPASSTPAFLPSGQFVLANGASVARHDDDIQVQRFNADGSLASASPAFDYSGAAGLD